MSTLPFESKPTQHRPLLFLFKRCFKTTNQPTNHNQARNQRIIKVMKYLPLFTLMALVVLPAQAGAEENDSTSTSTYRSEIKHMEGHTVKNSYSKPLPHTYIEAEDLPDHFSWGNVNGTSYLTRSLNQHIPQYCGSCWAHGSISALQDRVKIARQAQGPDIELSIQHILNCGSKVAGSCHGGTGTGTYDFIKHHAGFVSQDTCQPYLACSQESKEGFCAHVDTTCSDLNTCRTCNTMEAWGGSCSAIVDYFPNVTIAEYGTISFDAHKIMAEIYARGPVAAQLNAEPLVDYQGGIVDDCKVWHMMPNHIISLTGWGTSVDSVTGETTKYWIVRNSWGEYWGEMGFARVKMGHNCIGIESEVVWATPDTWTTHNKHCDEDGSKCTGNGANNSNANANMNTVKDTGTYVDPSDLLDEAQQKELHFGKRSLLRTNTNNAN
jgi:cathepsin X